VSLAKKVRICFGVALAFLFVGATVAARYNPHLNSFCDKLVSNSSLLESRNSSLSSPSPAS
jgi:hypothetical protein